MTGKRTPLTAEEKAARARQKKVDAARPVCLHCGPSGAVNLVKGAVIYPHRADLADLNMWRCGCGAYVGTHKGTIRALGSPANSAVQAARRAAHAAFDPLWKTKAEREAIPYHQARADGYRWLAEQMGLPGADTHIGMMDEAQARRVVDVVKAARKK